MFAQLERFIPRRLRERDVFLLYINVALYALCFQMQQPASLSLVKSLVSADSAKSQFAFVKSMNGVAQLIGSLVSGVLIDRIGCKGVFLLSFISSAISYTFVAAATDITHLYLAQIPSIFQHAVLAARAYVSIKFHDNERAEYMGYVGFAYGIGFVLGPIIGGWLASISLQLSASIAVVGSLVSILIVWGYTSDTLSNKRSENSEDVDQAGSTLSTWDGYKQIYRNEGLFWALVAKAFFSFATAIFHGTFQLIADERFGMDVAAVGQLLTYIGAVGMISQAAIVTWVSSRASDHTINIASGILIASMMLIYSFIVDQAGLYVLCAPLTVVSTVFSLTNTAQIAKMAPTNLKGTLVAVDMALFSGMRTWVPPLGAHLLGLYGYSSIGITSSISVFIMTLVFLVCGGRGQVQRAVSIPAEERKRQ